MNAILGDKVRTKRTGHATNLSKNHWKNTVILSIMGVREGEELSTVVVGVDMTVEGLEDRISVVSSPMPLSESVLLLSESGRSGDPT